MGHRDGMDSWDLGKMVWDIPDNPVPSRWVIGMGWTVGIWVGWCGISQVILFCPDRHRIQRESHNPMGLSVAILDMCGVGGVLHTLHDIVRVYNQVLICNSCMNDEEYDTY